MKRLDPDKLFVEFRPGVTKNTPLLGRKYTLTHSDITAELFLTLGLSYAYDKITQMRDEVLAEWRIENGRPYLYIYVYVDGQYGSDQSAVRNAIFRSELPLALEAIRYGDRYFFEAYPELDHAPILIRFDSTDPRYNRYEYWGTPKDYK
ncbi:staygreen family protein [Halobacillus sp. GSS1]|uniref:staygreen family protein n=1 Tax=Halobacillus sp. GSS1 TaxID=2815919 RepID=UPI001A8E093B|nr:staygreen family protein [Halobacillus sp. GSS1]MBN9654745.1 staygreen family protein [Halobacillus sp. GSS1]